VVGEIVEVEQTMTKWTLESIRETGPSRQGARPICPFLAPAEQQLLCRSMSDGLRFPSICSWSLDWIEVRLLRHTVSPEGSQGIPLCRERSLPLASVATEGLTAGSGPNSMYARAGPMLFKMQVRLLSNHAAHAACFRLKPELQK
jgi:hypothetical protein